MHHAARGQHSGHLQNSGKFIKDLELNDCTVRMQNLSVPRLSTTGPTQCTLLTNYRAPEYQPGDRSQLAQDTNVGIKKARDLSIDVDQVIVLLTTERVGTAAENIDLQIEKLANLDFDVDERVAVAVV
jgi:hypothetical protein